MNFIKQYKRAYKANTLKIIISIIFIFSVFLPLLEMIFYIDKQSLVKVFKDETFLKTLSNSLVAAIISTLISMMLAYFLSVCIERINIKFKSFFKFMFILPMLIPSISHGMGLIILFGNNGLITNLLGINGSIYGLSGIVMGSVLYTFPIAFLMISDIMRYEDVSPYEAAKVLGISKPRQFISISLPYLRKPLISVVFAVFSLIITDYGVPIIVGGKFTTLPVVMYNEVIGRLNFGRGAVYGCILLVPAVIAFILDTMNKDKGNSGFVVKQFIPDNDKKKKIIAYIFCFAISLITLLPIIAFLVVAFVKKYPINMTLTFDNLKKAFGLRAGEYLLNSLTIALFVSLIGVCAAFFVAYFSARNKSKSSRFLHLSAILTSAVPGLVLGLSYVLFFKGSFLYGTLAILIMVNIIHFISSPYLMIYNSLSKMNENLEGVGATLGISRLRLIKDVFIPQCKGTLIEMFSYFFVNSMMTISAVSFLSRIVTKPLSLLIVQFEDRLIECAAIVSIIILIVNLLIKLIAFLLKNIGKLKNKNKENSYVK